MTRPPLQLLAGVSTRLAVLRLVVASTLALLTCGAVRFGRDDPSYLPWGVWLSMLLVICTVIHHVGSMFGPRRFPLRRWMDIPLTSLEACFFVGLLLWFIVDLKSPYQPKDALISPETVLILVFICAVALGLVMLLFLEVAELRSTSRRAWTDRVDVAQMSQDPWWKYAAFTLLGRKLWEARVPGESSWLSVFRGIFTVLAIATMIAFATYQVIYSPVAEMGMIPHRQFRTPFFPEELLELDSRANWTVVVLWQVREGALKSIQDAVSIDWSFDTGYYINSTACDAMVPAQGNCDSDSANLFDLECLQSKPPTGWNDCVGWDSPPPLRAIRVRVDFTDLFPPGDSSRSQRDEVSQAVHIYVGLAEQFDAVTTATRPIHLFSGTNLLSVVDVVIRQRLKSPGLATLGFETRDSAFIIEPLYTVTNNWSNNTNRNIGTLTISQENLRSEWTVIQDFRTKSVLAGLSGVGGLGSLFSTLLVIFLGTLLMRAAMRSKEYSPLGLLHSGMSDKMAKACREKYPELEADIIRLQRNPGLVAYLFDTLVDMGPIGHHEATPKVEGHSTPRESAEMVELVPFDVQKRGDEDASLNLGVLEKS
ncbi:hypothetical protein NMY22_g6487 [Coprinellus aureogranulatus]|nr:hypothetical protein NMY22_g6487 [Coprinellus aureogranulatus]